MQASAIDNIDDRVSLLIEGEQIVIYENYTAEVSIMNQPAAFSLRLGWGKIAAELLKKCTPGKHFKLLVGGVTVMSGRIDRQAVPGGGPTVLEVKGRDYTAQLFDSYIVEERAFSESTFYELTRKVLDIVGLTEAKGHKLEPNNDNNRKAITGMVAVPRSREQVFREVATVVPAGRDALRRVNTLTDAILTGATSGGGKLVYKTLKAKLGTRWYDFLQDQYKLAGLFLWCAADGTFILARPETSSPPAYVITRQRGQTRNFTNIIAASHTHDTTSRHAMAIVYGRSGGTKAGRQKIRGEHVDPEMVLLGFEKPIAIHDDEIETKQQADFVARRHIAEERRSGWTLEYEVSGHTVPSSAAASGRIVWAPDTICQVDDQELGIKGSYYVESVTYSRGPQTTTKLKLVRPGDMLFGTEPER